MASRWRWPSLSLLLLSLNLQAAEVPDWHLTLSDWTRQLGAWLDARLSGREALDPHNPSRLHLGLLMRHNALQGPQLQPQIDLRLALPHTQRRFALVLSRESPDRLSDEQAESYPRSPTTPQSEQGTFLGLRYFQQTGGRLWQGVDGGLVMRGLEIGVYARWRRRDRHRLSPDWVRTASHELRWESLSGWLLSTGLDLDHGLDARHLWRLSGRISGQPDRRLVQLSLGTTLFVWLHRQRSLAVQLSGDWRNDPGGLHSLRLRALWSRTLAYEWSTLTVIPEVRVEQWSGYRIDPMISVRWTASFNEPAR